MVRLGERPQVRELKVNIAKPAKKSLILPMYRDLAKVISRLVSHN
jgi:hypothetical protein